MNSRLKKLVHRGKGEEKRRKALRDEQSHDPPAALSTSTSAKAASGNAPEGGDYPIIGRASSLLSKLSRSSSRTSQTSQRSANKLRRRRPTSLPAATPPTQYSDVSLADGKSASSQRLDKKLAALSLASLKRDDRPRRSPSGVPITGSSNDPTPTNSWSMPDAETVINQAQSNSEDVQISRTVAPLVTHETVTRTVHHIREEHITHEIHDHEVFHRIQPVVDVEVLPARHFLPMQGGGLMEVNAEDVPGRSQMWVVAETASQIPTNHAASTSRRGFSARKFENDDGDPKASEAPDGHPITEQTWVHPPVLATGARQTGQSWPLDVD